MELEVYVNKVAAQTGLTAERVKAYVKERKKAEKRFEKRNFERKIDVLGMNSIAIFMNSGKNDNYLEGKMCVVCWKKLEGKKYSDEKTCKNPKKKFFLLCFFLFFENLQFWTDNSLYIWMWGVLPDQRLVGTCDEGMRMFWHGI